MVSMGEAGTDAETGSCACKELANAQVKKNVKIKPLVAMSFLLLPGHFDADWYFVFDCDR